VKSAILIGAMAFAGLLVFGLSAVLLVNMRGGLGPQHAGLSRVPLVGGLLKVQPADEEEGAEEPDVELSGLPAHRDVPFLRYGSEARLQSLIEDLSARKSEYDSMLRGLERRATELDAWQEQLAMEREALRGSFAKEAERLTNLERQLAQKEKGLQALQVHIDVAEQTNLTLMAEMYGKMGAEEAARILTEMYGTGDIETVVKIIHLTESRSAAKTLAALGDAKISAQITAHLKRVTQTEQQGG